MYQGLLFSRGSLNFSCGRIPIWKWLKCVHVRVRLILSFCYFFPGFVYIRSITRWVDWGQDLLTVWGTGTRCPFGAWSFCSHRRLIVMPIQGAVCVVFGGSRGIGKAVCELLAKHGGLVAVLSRDAASAAKLAKTLSVGGSSKESSREPKSFSCDCDVSDPTSVIRSVSEVERTLGSIDVVVNSAGIKKDALLLRTKTVDIQDVISTNLLGSMYTTRAVLKSMLQRRTGCIINIGSIVGLEGNAGQTVYSASKAGARSDIIIYNIMDDVR